jgi:hypothetical protein
MRVGMYGKSIFSNKNTILRSDMQRSVIPFPILLHVLTPGQTAGQRDHVLSAQALSLFNQKKYFPAALSYAQCSVTFEEVALKFLDVGERDALRSYLISRLERSRKTVGVDFVVDRHNILTKNFPGTGPHTANDVSDLAS